jgi:EAL domain-containing protein (putative c-di-GMP-specific phosphodiesterase class I)
MEKAGLIKEIDDMVIRKAFHDLEMRIRKGSA